MRIINNLPSLPSLQTYGRPKGVQIIAPHKVSSLKQKIEKQSELNPSVKQNTLFEWI
jgi:hypothetical protein